MIAILSDTHRTEDHGLSGAAREAVSDASALIHAGDFTTSAVYESFQSETPRLEAVHGNRDVAALTDRLPAQRVFEVAGARVALVHGHEHGETALSLLGRSEDADLVVFGHSHRPTIRETGGPVLLNPGSHRQPRGFERAHAELDRVDEGHRVRLVAADRSEIGAARL